MKTVYRVTEHVFSLKTIEQHSSEAFLSKNNMDLIDIYPLYVLINIPLPYDNTGIGEFVYFNIVDMTVDKLIFSFFEQHSALMATSFGFYQKSKIATMFS